MDGNAFAFEQSWDQKATALAAWVKSGETAPPIATTFRKHRYAFRNIDIILLEGIFLFKPMYRELFDLKVWIDCSFATALRRAMARGQEGLPPQEAKRAFETIYFPAQRIHLARDNPRKAADIVFRNDTCSRQR